MITTITMVTMITVLGFTAVISVVVMVVLIAGLMMKDLLATSNHASFAYRGKFPVVCIFLLDRVSNITVGGYREDLV